MPRIAIWPLDAGLTVSGTAARNAKDKLIAFCASTGSNANGPLPYYFQRYQEAYVQRQYSDAAPGSSQSTTADYQLIPRNQQLLNYLSTFTQTAIPGFRRNV